MQKKQDQIKSQTAKEMERREEYAEESTRKIAEKYARSAVASLFMHCHNFNNAMYSIVIAYMY